MTYKKENFKINNYKDCPHTHPFLTKSNNYHVLYYKGFINERYKKRVGIFSDSIVIMIGEKKLNDKYIKFLDFLNKQSPMKSLQKLNYFLQNTNAADMESIVLFIVDNNLLNYKWEEIFTLYLLEKGKKS